MNVEDLLRPDQGLHVSTSVPETDPLTDVDALQEAQLLDVRFDALAGVVGILFELRTALQLDEADTGVLVAHGVRELSWSGPSRNTTLTAWTIGSSTPRFTGGLFGLELVLWPHPGARLSLAAARAAFFVGRVPGLSVAPPDYSDHDRSSIGSEVAAWGSRFEPVSASFLDPD